MTAQVQVASGRRFVAEVFNLTRRTLFLRTDATLTFRDRLTLTVAGAVLGGEVALVSNEPLGALVSLDASPETDAAIQLLTAAAAPVVREDNTDAAARWDVPTRVAREPSRALREPVALGEAAEETLQATITDALPSAKPRGATPKPDLDDHPVLGSLGPEAETHSGTDNTLDRLARSARDLLEPSTPRGEQARRRPVMPRSAKGRAGSRKHESTSIVRRRAAREDFAALPAAPIPEGSGFGHDDDLNPFTDIPDPTIPEGRALIERPSAAEPSAPAAKPGPKKPPF